MLPIDPKTEGRQIELARNSVEVQKMTARRIADALTWCAEAHRDQRMPGAVFADLIISCQQDAARVAVWNWVCAVLIGRGFPMFAKFLIEGE